MGLLSRSLQLKNQDTIEVSMTRSKNLDMHDLELGRGDDILLNVHIFLICKPVIRSEYLYTACSDD